MANKPLTGLMAYITGHAAEKKALSFLEKQGYQLVAMNVRPPRGIGANEIDLIACKDNTLVFIEVKQRKNYTDGAYAILPITQQRYYKAAEIYLAEHPEFQHHACRFDAIILADSQAPVHIIDAWRG